MRRSQVGKVAGVEHRDTKPEKTASRALAAGTNAGWPVVNVYWRGERIVILQRSPEGAIVRTQKPAEHVCFVKAAEVAPELLRQLRQSRFVLGVRDELHGWLRIRWATRDASIKASLKFFPEQGVTAYEGDVNPVRRWLVESEAPIARPRRAYLDLENDSRVPPVKALRGEARILSWALADDHGWSMRRLLAEDTDRSEAELLQALYAELERFDQVAAWGGDSYDFLMLNARTRQRRLQIEPKRWLWIDHLECFKRSNISASESGDEKQSFALNAIAMQVLKIGKLEYDDIDGAHVWEAWEEGGERRERLGNYNERDAQLMPQIEAKTGYLELLQTVCEVCGCLPDSMSIWPSVQVETYMMRLGSRRGIRYATKDPSKPNLEDQFRGAFVLEPREKGILRDVEVADFSRQYPSAILSWNMSPETLVEKPPPMRAGMPVDVCPPYLSHLPVVLPTRPEGVAEAPITGVWFDQRAEGVLPQAVGELLRLRDDWDEKKKQLPPKTPEWIEAERRSAAYKIVANSFPGVIGMKFGRLYNRAVAESVSQAGVWLIKNTIKAAEEQFSFRVLYSDTDACFVGNCTYDEFRKFAEWCTAELYPRLLREQGCARNTVKFVHEKGFDRIVLVAKKRYAARLSHYKGQKATAESEPEIKGLEFKRGDTARMARRFQEQAILKLLDGCEDPQIFDEMVCSWRARVLEADLELRDFSMSKRLSKSLKGYHRKKKKDGTMSALPPHVEVAHVLEKRGMLVGEGVKIDYLVIDAARTPMICAPAIDWDPKARKVKIGTELVDFDRFYLWEDLVYPPTQRVLEVAFPAHDWQQHLAARPSKLRAKAVALERAKQTDLFGASPKKTAKKKAPTAQADLFGHDRTDAPKPDATASTGFVCLLRR